MLFSLSITEKIQNLLCKNGLSKYYMERAISRKSWWHREHFPCIQLKRSIRNIGEEKKGSIGKSDIFSKPFNHHLISVLGRAPLCLVWEPVSNFSSSGVCLGLFLSASRMNSWVGLGLGFLLPQWPWQLTQMWAPDLSSVRPKQTLGLWQTKGTDVLFPPDLEVWVYD